MSSDRSKVYTDAGVNIEAGNEFVKRIKQSIASTQTVGVISDIGGFGGLFRPNMRNMKDPILVSSTDGVGTKLKLAFAFDKHDTVGIDLVAMSVNDILVQGASPLFFLDYFATGKLDIAKAESIVAGIAKGCKIAGCALLGGETAEMPDIYAEGEYDLAGFCVGIVDNKSIVDGSNVRVDNIAIGIASSGLHSNGYSLVRKILKQSGLQGHDTFPNTDKSVSDILLCPTSIYVDAIKNLQRDIDIKGMVHITGGGFYDNIPRILPRQVGMDINFGSWEMPEVFTWLKSAGNLSWPEMLQIFNCGIGYVVIVQKELGEEVISRLKAKDMPAWEIGKVSLRKDSEEEQVNIIF